MFSSIPNTEQVCCLIDIIHFTLFYHIAIMILLQMVFCAWFIVFTMLCFLFDLMDVHWDTFLFWSCLFDWYWTLADPHTNKYILNGLEQATLIIKYWNTIKTNTFMNYSIKQNIRHYVSCGIWHIVEVYIYYIDLYLQYTFKIICFIALFMHSNCSIPIFYNDILFKNIGT